PFRRPGRRRRCLRHPDALASRQLDLSTGPVRDWGRHALFFLRLAAGLRCLGAGAAPSSLGAGAAPSSLDRFALAASTLARSVSVRSAGPPGVPAGMAVPGGRTTSLPSILAWTSASSASRYASLYSDG